jgi:hypothetical protein
MLVTPIRPQDVVSTKLTIFPDKVIETWNKMIATHYSGKSSHISQREIVDKLADVMNVNETEILKRGWLDIEDIYRKVGWKVDYDKPGFNETYEPTFIFTEKKG